jgi:hypothetical protein
MTTTAILSTSSRKSTSKGSPWKTQVSFHISCYRKDLYQSLEITTIHNYQECPGLLLERLPSLSSSGYVSEWRQLADSC